MHVVLQSHVSITDLSFTNDVIYKNQLSDNIRGVIEDEFASSIIPSPQISERLSRSEMKVYETRYRIAHHDANFRLAESISRAARNVKSAKETRWSAIIKNRLFGHLIKAARQAEGIGYYGPKEILEGIKMFVVPNLFFRCSFLS